MSYFVGLPVSKRFIVITTCLISSALFESGIINFGQAFGFSCNDPKLSHKYKGDTVSPGLLLSVTFFFPFVVFGLTEWFTNEFYLMDGSPLRTRVLNSYLNYLRGLSIVFLIINIGKSVVGEPRPHFLETCRPIEAINCSRSAYFSTYNCKDPHAVSSTDSFRSFPSGHAALSVYMSTALGIFVQKRLTKRWANVCLVVLYVWAAVCSVSRIIDRRHHWWDVLAGVVIGTTVSSSLSSSLSGS